MSAMRLALVIVLALARPAQAEPAERGDGARLGHGLAPFLGGALYLLTEFALKDRVSPLQCRLCEPNAFDRRARAALVWRRERIGTADFLSNVTGYIGN